MERWRLIKSPAASGAANMAMDESLLPPSSQGTPTLRLYSFHPAAVSIGFSQPASQIDQAALAALGLELVRRPTGGRAVLHLREVTYALALPLSHPLAAGGVEQSYRRLAAALVAALRFLGLEAVLARGRSGSSVGEGAACFLAPSRSEILAGDKKIAGSAQLRRSGWLLQQVSLPLSQDRECLRKVLRLGQGRLRGAGSLEEALDRSLQPGEVEEALLEGFRLSLGVWFQPGRLTPGEEAQVEHLLHTKYGQQGWNQRGSCGLGLKASSVGHATE